MNKTHRSIRIDLSCIPTSKTYVDSVRFRRLAITKLCFVTNVLTFAIGEANSKFLLC
jgi:hypothetical protein